MTSPAPSPGATIDFNGGTNGAALAAGGAISAVSGTTTYSTSAAKHGALGITSTGTTTTPTFTIPRPAGFTNANLSFTLSLYHRPQSIPGSSIQVASPQNSVAAVIAQLRTHSDGKFDVAVGGTRVGSSTLTWVANTWYRLDMSYNGSTNLITVKIFAGTNAEGTTPSDTFTATAATQPGGFAQLLMSTSRSATAGCVGDMDTIRLYDGVVTPAPFAPVAGLPVWVKTSGGAFQTTRKARTV